MKIALVSDNRFPDADAGAVRENILANMLIKEGHEVYRIGRFCKKDRIIDGVTCFSVPDKGKNSKGNMINLLLFNYNIMKLVKETHNVVSYDAFLITGCKARLVNALKSFAIKNNILLVYNSVEFYSAEQFKHGKYARQFRNNRNIALKIIDEHFRVISISSFLNDLFEKRGVKSIRIPFILDHDSMKYKPKNNERVELAYVGRPSRSKDYLKDFLDAMTKLTQEELKRIHLTVVGVNAVQLKENFSITDETLEYIGDSIDAKGLVPREEAMRILSGVDFTILYRSNQEVYAKAGFPTKVTESLMSGIPVITNLTSDLGMYINDGINGFVIDEDNSITDCYRKAISISNAELQKMKIQARNSAEKYLDASKYVSELNSLFIR